MNRPRVPEQKYDSAQHRVGAKLLAVLISLGLGSGEAALAGGTVTAQQALDADTTALAQTTESNEEVLGPITVEGDRPASPYEPVQGYQGKEPARSSAATKIDAPVVDTPASVSSVNQALIEDQGARNLDQTLRNIAGVGHIANEGNVGGQNDITLRGFSVDRIFKNGFQINNSGAPLGLADVARVEVLKGPASILYGAVSPGGVVNIVPKQPTIRPLFSVSAQADEHGAIRTTLDTGGSLVGDGVLTHRTVVSRTAGDTFIDRVEQDDAVLAHTLRWRPTDASTFDFHAEHTRDDGTFEFGIPFDDATNEPSALVPADRFLGEAFNEKRTETTLVQLKGEHRLTARDTVRWHAGYLYDVLFATALRPTGPGSVQPDGTITRSYSLRDDDTDKQLQLDVDYIHTADWFGMAHTVLAGMQYRDEETESGPLSGNNGSDDVPDVNVRDPRYNRVSDRELQESANFVFFGPPGGPRAGGSGEQLQLVLQDSAWITPRLNLLASLGYTDVESTSFFPTFGIDSRNTGSDVLPRLGVLYKPRDRWSVYASYSESLQPNFGGNPNGQAFEPTEGDQVEVGFKRELGATGLISLAAYELSQTNIPEPIGDGSGFSRLIGEVRSRGTELELTTRLVDILDINASYAYIDSEIVTPGNANEGNRNPNVPEHRASLWLHSELWQAGARHLDVGGGVFYTDERFVNSTNIRRLPSYTTVDLQAGYSTELPNGDALRFQLNLLNAFDERYFEAGFVNAASPGESRTLLGSVTWEMGAGH